MALAGTFLWSCANIIDKVLRTNHLKDSFTLMVLFIMPETVYTSFLFAIVGMPELPFWHMVAAFFGGIIFPVSATAYFKSLSLEEASRVIPLFNLIPVFVLAMAVIFLNEILAPLNYLAFFLILLGGVLISSRRIKGVFHLSKAVGFMLLASVIIAMADVLLKFSLQAGIFWHTILVYSFGVLLGELSLLLLPAVRKNVFSKAIYSKKVVSLVFLSFFFGVSGGLLYNWALLYGPVTILSTFVAFQSLFVLLTATLLSYKFPLFLKEATGSKTLGIKITAILLMAAGLFLLNS